MKAIRFRFPRVVVAFAVLLLIAGSAFAQATTTGAISGTATTSDGVAVPGVTVTVSGPALMGSRTAYTGDNGDYIIRGLPPGSYTVEFTMEGMATVKRNVSVELGQTSKADASMSMSSTSEAITVTADAPTLMTTTQLGTNLNSEQIQELPIPRGGGFLANIAALTPGVTQNTFNAGQVRINGAFAYDNVFLVDGTDVNDNLFGTAHNLYIEDAIQETQVMTGGVSAEYGRFTGGVINVVTKSGGNDFSGSFRTDVTNSAWRDETPNEAQRLDKNNYIYSGTLGGPILRDRLWFFLAGRRENTEESRNLPITNIAYIGGTENPRYEVKLTGSLANQSLQVSYLDNEATQVNNIGLAGRTMDPRAFVTRTLPNTRKAAFYNGIITSNLFAEVKYSEKEFGFRNTGGTSTDIHDSPFLTRSHSPSRHFNAPFFDSSDPEDRNNKDITASASYFLSTKVVGTHDFKGGWERYTSTRTGGNSQSSTNYVFGANYKTADGSSTGTPVTDSQGRYIPIFTPVSGATSTQPFTTLTNWQPIRGATVDIATDAFFVTDTWTINRRLTANIGGRFETTSGTATGDIDTVDASRFTPRLALSVDPMANGKYKVDLTYAEYAGKFSERQFAVNTNVGTPNSISYRYIGPAGEGVDYAPGFDLANYEITSASFPLRNVLVDDDIVSPIAKEWTISGATSIGRFGFAKATYTTREWSDFWEDFINTSTGFTEFAVTPTITRRFDNTLYSNTSDLFREYEAIQLLSQWRLFNHWTLHGNYTHELRNHGNFVGEAGNQPGNPSTFGDYPEIRDSARHYPDGKMPGYQKHRLRLLNNYELGLGRAGSLDVGVVFNYDSAQSYSFLATGLAISSVQSAKLTAAGYKSPPTSQTVYFNSNQYLDKRPGAVALHDMNGGSGLGSGTFNGYHSFDFALTYSIPIVRSIAPRVKFEVYNVTNEQDLRFFNTTVAANTTDAASVAACGGPCPVDALGLPTTFRYHASRSGDPTNIDASKTTFGLARDASDYQVPREYRVSVSLTF
jgi:hypothetical protein